MPLYLGEKQISDLTIAFDGSGISTGTDTSDATLATGAQMLSPYTAYSNDKKYTGTIATVEAPTPSISVSTTGLVTASVSNPKGYQSSATTKTATQQLTTQGAKVITPSDSAQTAVSSGTYVTGDIKVSAIPTGVLSTPTVNESTGLVTAGVSTSGYLSTSATKTLQLTTKSATTITPGINDQTITAGRYLTGAQIIKGDANLVSENIISGKSIFGVSGSVVIQKYYTGSTEPSSSLGNDGDLYLKV